MQRYNIYKQVNKGIRALLFETALQVQQADFSDRAQGNEAVEKLKEALMVIEKCNHLQNLYIFPVARQYELALTVNLEKENMRVFLYLAELRELCTNWSHSATTEEAEKNGRIISATFIQFMVFNLQHLPKKEESLNEVLCTHFTDREIFRLKLMIVGRMEQQEILALSKWIIRGLNNKELIDWLQEMQKYVSTEIFRSLCFIAERELPLTRFSVVIDELSEGSLLT